MPKEHREFALRRRTKPFTQEKLMRILNQTEGGDLAKQVYKRLTGLNPPPEDGEIVMEEGEPNGQT